MIERDAVAVGSIGVQRLQKHSPLRVVRGRVLEFPILDALPAVKVHAAVMAERAFGQVDAEALVDIVELGREKEVRRGRAGSVGAARRHSSSDMNCLG